MTDSRKQPGSDPLRISWFATQGSGSNDAQRIKTLLSGFSNSVELPFKRNAKLRSLKDLLLNISHEKPALLVMEGTGIAGGMACLVSKALWNVPYVVDSGDAVGPFIAAHFPLAGLAAGVYERILCRYCAGFIGWTPYLCGRALTFGAPRAVTAPGWTLGDAIPDCEKTSSSAARERFGIPLDAVVVGLVGSLQWNRHRQYCYGLELVQCAHRLRRTDTVFLIIGEGSGLKHLRETAGRLLGTKIFLPGSVPHKEVLPALSAMDVASLPQSMDGVGLFRYTTKISEYAEARLPVITSRIPMAYDLGQNWMWRLPGAGPWESTFIDAFVTLLENLDRSQIECKRDAIPRGMATFQRDVQIARVTDFLKEIVADNINESR